MMRELCWFCSRAPWSTSLATVLVLFAAQVHSEESAYARALGLAQGGKSDEAISVITQALAVDSKDTSLYTLRSKIYSKLKNHAKAADDLNHVAQSGEASAFRHAGAEYFFAGKFADSIAAFDAYAKHFPDQAPHLWERGISLYYAQRYAEGRKQFEEHKSVNPHDVENAAWHFICAAKEMGVDAARKSILFIDTTQDTRVPMKEVYLLFKGEGKPEDVLAAATAGHPDAETLKNNLCYAHLYLGLYAEALNDEKSARAHLEKAAVEFAQEHYMGQVARVHWALLKDKK